MRCGDPNRACSVFEVGHADGEDWLLTTAARGWEVAHAGTWRFHVRVRAKMVARRAIVTLTRGKRAHLENDSIVAASAGERRHLCRGRRQCRL